MLCRHSLTKFVIPGSHPRISFCAIVMNYIKFWYEERGMIFLMKMKVKCEGGRFETNWLLWFHSRRRRRTSRRRFYFAHAPRSRVWNPLPPSSSSSWHTDLFRFIENILLATLAFEDLLIGRSTAFLFPDNVFLIKKQLIKRHVLGVFPIILVRYVIVLNLCRSDNQKLSPKCKWKNFLYKNFSFFTTQNFSIFLYFEFCNFPQLKFFNFCT